MIFFAYPTFWRLRVKASGSYDAAPLGKEGLFKGPTVAVAIGQGLIPALGLKPRSPG